MKNAFALLISLLAFNALAAETVQVLEGTGIDQNRCRIEIVRDGNQLKDISIQGAALVFEILSERGSGYGPRREINPAGGEEILLDSPDIYDYFRHSRNLFSEGETFYLDTKDMPQSSEGFAGLKMQITVALNYRNGELVSATVVNKAKALVIATLASSKFTCRK